MKHLRRFYESKEQLTEEEVQDFCEMNLAYLMDDGLKVLVQKIYFGFGHTDYKVTLSFRLITDSTWGTLKDQVIPFLTHLRNEYEVIVNSSFAFSHDIEFTFFVPVYRQSYDEKMSIDDVILERSPKFGFFGLNDDYKILSFQFKIKGEKV